MWTRTLTAVVLAEALACTSPVERESRMSARYDSVAPERGAAVARRALPASIAAQQQAVASAGELELFPRSSIAPTMLIRTGQASVEVDSLEPAVVLVRALAGRVGGYIANTAMQTGHGQLRSATIEVKIPSERFDEALAGLGPIGKLESVNVSAEDVGEEFTDVTARMENARRLESRLIELVATRTGKLKDVLDVERELARVREEIDRYDGRLRYLKAHASLSTLTIGVHEPVPVVGHPGSSVVAEAFKQAWRNFVELMAWCIRALGVVVPLGVMVAFGRLALRRWRPA